MKQGISHVVATPHFYANQRGISSFLEKREKSYEKVKELLDKRPDLPSLSLGAEVYYFPGMSKAEALPKVCYEGTNILLLEMPFAQWDKQIVEDVKNIINKQGLRIIMAHVERYYKYQKDKSFWNEIWDLPIIAQINAGSFLNWKKRGFCFRFIKEHDIILLGSDCHNMKYRAPNIEEGRKVLEKKFGMELLHSIDEYGREILGIRD